MRLSSWLKLLLISLLAMPFGPVTAAAEAPDAGQAAQVLLAATVTVRISPPPQESDEKGEQDADLAETLAAFTASDRVTVCSGTSLGDGLIMTFDPASVLSTTGAARFRYRVTIPGGRQSDAVPRVLDQYSGLVLLEIDRKELPAVELAKELPAVGSRVVGASAEGIEQPLVSMGIVSKIDRRIRGTSLPPMLTCDISTTEASSGGALVDTGGKLVGVIAATSLPQEKSNWTFAVPARHVQRVLDARAPDRLIVLMRRRPVVGLVLGQGPVPGTVQVERVFEDGPADKVGLRRGDLVLEAGGHRIRNAYQALALIRKHIPGEEFEFLVEQEGKQRRVKVTLGGGAAREVKLDQQGYAVGPQIDLRVTGRNLLELRSGQGVRELSVDGEDKPARSAGNEVDLLRRQLEAYQHIIKTLHRERKEHREREEETQKQLDALHEEVSRLKKQVDGK